jgi:hypothetical protein
MHGHRTECWLLSGGGSISRTGTHVVLELAGFPRLRRAGGGSTARGRVGARRRRRRGWGPPLQPHPETRRDWDAVGVETAGSRRWMGSTVPQSPAPPPARARATAPDAAGCRPQPAGRGGPPRRRRRVAAPRLTLAIVSPWVGSPSAQQSSGQRHGAPQTAHTCGTSIGVGAPHSSGSGSGSGTGCCLC